MQCDYDEWWKWSALEVNTFLPFCKLAKEQRKMMSSFLTESEQRSKWKKGMRKNRAVIFQDLLCRATASQLSNFFVNSFPNNYFSPAGWFLNVTTFLVRGQKLNLLPVEKEIQLMDFFLLHSKPSCNGTKEVLKVAKCLCRNSKKSHILVGKKFNINGIFDQFWPNFEPQFPKQYALSCQLTFIQNILMRDNGQNCRLEVTKSAFYSGSGLFKTPRRQPSSALTNQDEGEQL